MLFGTVALSFGLTYEHVDFRKSGVEFLHEDWSQGRDGKRCQYADEDKHRLRDNGDGFPFVTPVQWIIRRIAWFWNQA